LNDVRQARRPLCPGVSILNKYAHKPGGFQGPGLAVQAPSSPLFGGCALAGPG
jgi:hypothetical protein